MCIQDEYKRIIETSSKKEKRTYEVRGTYTVHKCATTMFTLIPEENTGKLSGTTGSKHSGSVTEAEFHGD